MNLDARITSYLRETSPPDKKMVLVRPENVYRFNPRKWRQLGQVVLLNGFNAVYLTKGR